MKKIGILGAIMLLLSFAMSCSSDNNYVQIPTNNPAGKLLILQAYGNAGEDAAPAGVSHSFIELYNITDEEIDLTGTTLWFASGRRGTNVIADEAWQSISLTGKKVPAKGSFLILGKKHSAADNSATRLMLTDGSGDINSDTLELSRRGFKAALIYGVNQLGVNYPNPFTGGTDGKPILGYVDMVGAVNNPDNAENPDNIFGFETAPARNSASEAVRRKNNIDTDNNANDFMRARYALGAASGDNYPSMTAEELEAWKPRNAGAGSWEAFAAPSAFQNIPGVDYTKLKLNEVNGTANQKWFEIYNTGNTAINLAGVTAYYDNATLGYRLTWTGSSQDVIPANGFYATPIGNGDNLGTGLSANNLNVKLQLRMPDGTVLDTYQKPTGVNTNSSGNYPALADRAHARIPDGTGNWYYLTNSAGTHGASNGTSTAGCTLFGNEISSLPEPVEGLIIFQAYAPGWVSPELTGSNDNTNTGSVSHNFIELYNNTDQAINLNTYSIQWANGVATGGGMSIAADQDWNVINLTGTIPAKGSFLIRGREVNPTNGRLQVVTGDMQDDSLYMSNRSYKIALVSNQIELTRPDVWDNVNQEPYSNVTGLTDLVGTKNGNNEGVQSYKVDMRTMSKQNAIRRNSLGPNNNNYTDFAQIDYRTSGTTDQEVDKYKPRNSSVGAWTPEF